MCKNPLKYEIALLPFIGKVLGVWKKWCFLLPALYTSHQQHHKRNCVSLFRLFTKLRKEDERQAKGWEQQDFMTGDMVVVVQLSKMKKVKLVCFALLRSSWMKECCCESDHTGQQKDKVEKYSWNLSRCQSWDKKLVRTFFPPKRLNRWRDKKSLFENVFLPNYLQSKFANNCCESNLHWNKLANSKFFIKN